MYALVDTDIDNLNPKSLCGKQFESIVRNTKPNQRPMWPFLCIISWREVQPAQLHCEATTTVTGLLGGTCGARE